MAVFGGVSIQPKPKTGLEVGISDSITDIIFSFNPAEAEDGFRSSVVIGVVN